MSHTALVLDSLLFYFEVSFLSLGLSSSERRRKLASLPRIRFSDQYTDFVLNCVLNLFTRSVFPSINSRLMKKPLIEERFRGSCCLFLDIIL